MRLNSEYPRDRCHFNENVEDSRVTQRNYVSACNVTLWHFSTLSIISRLSTCVRAYKHTRHRYHCHHHRQRRSSMIRSPCTSQSCLAARPVSHVALQTVNSQLCQRRFPHRKQHCTTPDSLTYTRDSFLQPVIGAAYATIIRTSAVWSLAHFF